MKTFAEAGVPAGAIRTIDEVYEWDQTRSQGLVIEVDHATLGVIELPGPAVRFEHLDGGAAGRITHTAPPRVDEHATIVRQVAAGS